MAKYVPPPPPSHYLKQENGRLYICRSADHAVSKTYRDTLEGHKKAAAQMASYAKSERQIHYQLLHACPQHVKDQLNGKTAIQPESVQREEVGKR